MNQCGLIKSIIEKVELKDAKPSDIPLSSASHNIQSEECTPETPFRQLIGSLMYVARSTRPDIMFAVSYLSRKLEKPYTHDWKQAKMIVRYLKGTINQKFSIYGTVDEDLIVYSDADFANSEDKRSTSGCLVILGTTIISWFSRKQSLTALSTTESEFIALGESMRELLFWKELLRDMGIYPVTSIIKCDNQSSIKIALSEGMNCRTKHFGEIVSRLESILS